VETEGTELPNEKMKNESCYYKKKDTLVANSKRNELMYILSF